VDTLVVAVPPARVRVLLGLAGALALVTVGADPAGRLLAVPAAVAALALAVRDLRSGPVLRADRTGVEVLQGLRRVRAEWGRVRRIQVVRDRRAELLELDLGDGLVLLSRHRLGRLPADVLADLLSVRAAAERS